MEICLDLRLPRDASSVPVVRRLLDSSLAVLGVDVPIREDIRLMLTEACGNVIEHAEHTDDYTVRAEVVDECCLIKVIDSGKGFDAEQVRRNGRPAPTAERGRGLLIMRALADDVRFTCLPENGALVTLKKQLHYGKDAAGRMSSGPH